jgi:hypothetical protein
MDLDQTLDALRRLVVELRDDGVVTVRAMTRAMRGPLVLYPKTRPSPFGNELKLVHWDQE